MNKQKRIAFALKSVLANKEAKDGGRYFPFHQLSQAAEDLGFEQILPPPVEERKIFSQDEIIKKHFGTRFLDIEKVFDRDLILSPSYLPSVCRRYLQNVREIGPHVAKWFYASPILGIQDNIPVLYHELGILILGEDSILSTVHLINAVASVLENLHLTGNSFEVNSVGCRICQKDYQNLLSENLLKRRLELCEDCKIKLEEFPLGVWSCQVPGCRAVLETAPQIVDFLDESCRSQLVGVLEAIDALSIPYILNPALMGQILHEKVLFQVKGDGNAVLGTGGNFSRLSKSWGQEEATPLLGFLTTFEKLEPSISQESRKLLRHYEVFLISLGENAALQALLLQKELKGSGVSAGEAILGNNGIKNQLRETLDHHCEIALIIGQKEALDDTVILRDIRSGMQEVFSRERIIEEVKKRLGRQ